MSNQNCYYNFTGGDHMNIFTLINYCLCENYIEKRKNKVKKRTGPLFAKMGITLLKILYL